MRSKRSSLADKSYLHDSAMRGRTAPRQARSSDSVSTPRVIGSRMPSRIIRSAYARRYGHKPARMWFSIEPVSVVESVSHDGRSATGTSSTARGAVGGRTG